VVSTYSKDRATTRILGRLIENAYNTNSHVQYGKYNLESGYIQDSIQEIIYETGGTTDTPVAVMNASDKLAERLLTDPNLFQDLQKSRRVIPLKVVKQIHDFLDHASAFNEELPTSCPTYDQCEKRPRK